jgi:fibronectin-binding autotransporter adhesin
MGLTAIPAATYGDKTKADNNTPLNLGSSWVEGTIPTTTDLAIFNSTLVNNSAFSLGDNVQSWSGIRLTNPASSITINAGNRLTLGVGGIDLTAALKNLTLNDALTLSASQTWDSGTTSTLLTVGGALNLGAGTLTNQGGGITTLAGNVSNGSLVQNGAGKLLLSGTNTFARLTENAGNVQLQGGASFPAATILTMTGGALNLNGFATTVAQLTGSGGAISDNATSAGATVLTVNQSANTTFGGTISDGATRKLTVTKASTGSFTLSGANTYTGGTTFQQGTLVANNNSALGTGTVTLSTIGNNSTRLMVNGGITINNPVLSTATVAGAGNNGVLMYGNGTGDATFAGAINLAGGVVTSGGDIGGGPTNGTLNSFLVFTGPITTSASHSFIIVRFGNVRFSGGGNYSTIDLRTGLTQLGATNGIATNAVVDLGGNGSEIWDLNGFNQTIVGLKNTVTPGNAKTLTNSAGALSIFTFAPTTGGSFTFGGAGTAVMSGNLGITMAGAANSVQTLSTNLSTYTGPTTLTSGILEATSLSVGGAPSSIGASTSDASNLVFNGGTLRYIGLGDSTDRSFTISPGKTAIVDVQGASNLLTMSGNSPASTGGFTKVGLGTLILSGSHNYTGATTVATGTLLVDGSLAAGSAASISAGASLGGSGKVGGVLTVGSGAFLSPGDGGVGTITVGGLAVGPGSNLNFEFNGSSNDLVAVTNSGALSLTGGNLFLLNAGATTAFASDGTYTLLSYIGSFSGALSNLSVTNVQAGKNYALINDTTGHTIQLTIVDGVTSEWNSANGGLWTIGPWTNGVPNSASITAKFGNNLTSPGTVTLSGPKTVGALIFDNSNSYTLGGTDTLTLDAGIASAAVNVNNGSHTIAVNVQLNSAMTVNAGSGTQLTISGNIAGNRGIALFGSGNLVLTGSNAYTTTTVNGGNLTVGDGTTHGALGTSDVNLIAGGTVTLNRSDALSIPNNITGTSGQVIQNGSGTITLSGNNSFGTSSGGLIINNGTVKVGGPNGLPAGVIVTANFGTLDLNGNSASIASLNGSAQITDNAAGAGTSTLTDSGSDASFFSGSITNGASRSIALIKTGTGTLTLSNVSTYSGGTTVNQGVLATGSPNALGTGTVTLNVSGSSISRLDVGGDLPNNIVINAIQPGSGLGAINGISGGILSGSITVNGGAPGGAGQIAGPASGILQFTGPITATGSLIIRAGNVSLSGGGSYPQLQVQAGTTTIGANNGIATTTQVLIGTNGAATIDLNGFNQTLQSAVQSANNDVITNSNASASSTLTLSPIVDDAMGGGLALTGNLSLVKTGAAVVIISAANSYTGLTVINQGTLNVGSNANLGAPATGAPVNFNGGTLLTTATFALDNGTNGNMRSISIGAAGGTFSVTTGTTLTISGVISGSGPLTLANGQLLVTGSANFTGSTSLAANSTLEFGGGVTHNVMAISGAGNLQVDSSTASSTTLISTGVSVGGTWTINGTHIIRAGSGNAGTSLVSTVPTISGTANGTTTTFTGMLNLNDNRLIVEASDSTDKGNKMAALTALLKSGSSGGTWTGTGISSSTAAADPGHLAVGLFDNAVLALNSFGGQAVDANSIFVAVAHIGDANRNGVVDIQDQSLVTNHWQSPQNNWSAGDLNGDGFVDIQDLTLVTNNWQATSSFSQSVSTLATGGSSGVVTTVPEPGGLLVLALGSTALLKRRRRS